MMSTKNLWKASFVLLQIMSVVSRFDASILNCSTSRLCSIPGSLDQQEVPQMVLFTYTGEINARTRTILEEIFPKTFPNANGCPIDITLFAISQDVDPCSLRKLHARGHEVALSGLRHTSRVDNWNSQRWNYSIFTQHRNLANTSHIDQADIVGMRAQGFHPGNNSQFQMLNVNGFVYDSSLLVNQSKFNSIPRAHFWPFKMTDEILDDLDCQDKCPNDTYEGLWEVPGSRLFLNDEDKLGCPFLDQCFEGSLSSTNVVDLLKNNFDDVYNDNRAPFQINLRERHLGSTEMKQGIQAFISYIYKKNDVWLITMKDMMQWVKNPIENSHLTKGYWICQFNDKIKCSEQTSNSTTKKVTFAAIINVDQIWIWQTAFLVVLYIVIYRYDKYMQEKKKK